MFDTFKPLGNRVLVKLVEEEKKTESGIIIPAACDERPVKGSVLAVGPGKINKDGELVPTGVSVGDTIYIGQYAGEPLDEHHVVMRADDIVGLLV